MICMTWFIFHSYLAKPSHEVKLQQLSSPYLALTIICAFMCVQDDDDDDSGDDFGDLHEQFAAQEKLLGELRGVLKSNEEKLESKEKVVKVRIQKY